VDLSGTLANCSSCRLPSAGPFDGDPRSGRNRFSSTLNRRQRLLRTLPERYNRHSDGRGSRIPLLPPHSTCGTVLYYTTMTVVFLCRGGRVGPCARPLALEVWANR
jgi:hypothetical protein